MTLGIALLGAGRIGQVHAAALGATPQARLVAVADVSQAAAASLIARFGGEQRNIDAIARDDDIDAVVICTPTNTHADLIEKFARAGKAIFCEKPIDLRLDRVRSCLEVVNATDAHLMVGFNRRFDPHFQALKQAIVTGQIGKVEMINIISRDPGPPPEAYIKVSGGIFSDMTIHDFDMARFLLGEEVTSVIAVASVLVDARIGEWGDFDSANVILTTASGRQCAISNSRRASYGYDQRIEVHGAKGMVRARNHHQVGVEIATGDGFTRPALAGFFMDRYVAAYGAEIDMFIASIKDRDIAVPDGQDGLKALEIAQAARISVREGRKVDMSEVTEA